MHARRTVISYAAPRKRRVAVKPGHADGMTGSTLRPSSSGLMPRIHWVIATKFHAAVPVSQEFFASPWVGACRQAMICAWARRLQAVHLAGRLDQQPVDAADVVEVHGGVTGDRRARSWPRVGDGGDAQRSPCSQAGSWRSRRARRDRCVEVPASAAWPRAGGEPGPDAGAAPAGRASGAEVGPLVSSDELARGASPP